MRAARLERKFRVFSLCCIEVLRDYSLPLAQIRIDSVSALAAPRMSDVNFVPIWVLVAVKSVEARNQFCGLVIQALSMKCEQNALLGKVLVNVGCSHRQENSFSSPGQTPDTLWTRRYLNGDFLLLLVQQRNPFVQYSNCFANCIRLGGSRATGDVDRCGGLQY